MVDGRFIPGLRALGAPILNWQGEAEAAITLIGTDDDLLAEGSAARRYLTAFVARLSIADSILAPGFPFSLGSNLHMKLIGSISTWDAHRAAHRASVCEDLSNGSPWISALRGAFTSRRKR